jgi:glycosyltransferase involved in cell wall biosynthesis
MVNSSINPYQVVVDANSPYKALSQIYRETKLYKPDLVVCVEPLTILVGLALRRKFGSRVVFDCHEFFADAHAERSALILRPLVKAIYLAALRFLAHRTDAVWAVNQEILTQLFPANPRADNLLVLPNYPVANVWDYQCDVPGALAQLCEMKFDLIYVGGLTKDRGIFKILKCATLLKADFPRIKILILGKFHDSAIEAEFHDYINNYNLNAIIYYQEWIPAEKIGLLLKRSRFGLWLFNPRLKRMSLATPLKVLEYFAAGLPVISIKTPLMKSLIDYNKLGILCSYRSHDITTAIAKMLKMPEEEYQAMSKRCIEISESRFNWESLEPALYNLLDKLG